MCVNCQNNNCNGCNNGVSTNCGCTEETPCLTPSPCSERFDSNCVIYTGVPIQCNGEIIVDTGTSISNALVNLIRYIQNINNVVCGGVCENAYDYMINYAIANKTNILTPAQALNILLEKGLVLPISSNSICCPVCGPYVLGSVETYLKYAEALGITEFNEECQTIAGKCCTNLNASVETYLKYGEALNCLESGGPNPLPFPSPPYVNQCEGCDNGFASDIEILKELDPGLPYLIAEEGIVESGSLNTNLTSNISDFQRLIVALFEGQGSTPTSSIVEITENLLANGIILSCYDGQLVLATVETWLQYAEASGLTCNASVPL